MTAKSKEADVTVVADGLSRQFVAKGVKVRNRISGKRSSSNMCVHALQGVSFVAHRGESIGVLGQNGSGKSTLLQIVAGKDRPTAGRVLVSSEPSLLGVSAALQPHLSGVDNVRIGCLAMGMLPGQLDDAISDVSEFCDIGDAIFRPLQTYSSGMAARLRFAIATTVRPEILLVDEALSTGDATFNSRAEERMRNFLGDTGTVFVVSHAPRAIQRTCERAMWLHEGELIADGPTEDVGALYESWSSARAARKLEDAEAVLSEARTSFRKLVIEYV